MEGNSPEEDKNEADESQRERTDWVMLVQDWVDECEIDISQDKIEKIADILREA